MASQLLPMWFRNSGLVLALAAVLALSACSEDDAVIASRLPVEKQTITFDVSNTSYELGSYYLEFIPANIQSVAPGHWKVETLAISIPDTSNSTDFKSKLASVLDRYRQTFGADDIIQEVNRYYVPLFTAFLHRRQDIQVIVDDRAVDISEVIKGKRRFKKIEMTFRAPANHVQADKSVDGITAYKVTLQNLKNQPTPLLGRGHDPL